MGKTLLNGDIMAEELRYTTEEEGNVFQQYDTISPNRNVGDCCQMAKDEWVHSINVSISDVNNSRKQEIAELLDPSALDCRSFYNLLKELRLVNSSGDVIGSTNSILGRYFRLEKVTTSLLSSIATVAKVAGVKALTSWIQCSRDKEDEPDPQWQQQLRRDYV